MSYKTRQTGFSLIELMIAMVLGLIVSAVAIQVFVGNKGTYKLENSLSRLQENGRYIVENIVQDLRMAGYNGCASRGATIDNVFFDDAVIAPLTIDGTTNIRGYNDNGTSWNPAIDANLNLNGASPSPDVIDGTDVLNIMRAANCGAHLTGNHNVADTNILVNAPNNCGFAQNQPVMVTNCKATDVFRISAVPGIVGTTQTLQRNAPLNTTGDLSAAYTNDAQVFRWLSNTYLIATSVSGSGEPALFRSSWAPDGDGDIQTDDYNVAELADGVEDLQIEYGEDTGGDAYADNYLTADAVTDWTSVRSIRINLLLRSEDLLTQAPRIIPFYTGTAGGADRRLRMAYTTTITLRNNLQ